MESLWGKICHLNTASLGSFGEKVFWCVAKSNGWRIKPRHKNRVDFFVNDEPYDVKTTRQAKGKLDSFKNGRLDNVKYALVKFKNDGAEVSGNSFDLVSLGWEEIGHIWEKWIQRRGGTEEGIYDSELEVRKKEIAKIKQQLCEYFREHHKILRIIYRTNAAGFKEESPHNLKPSKIVKDRITIYLDFDFKDKKISRDKLRNVFVFPDEISDSLPSFDGRLHTKKVNLSHKDVKRFTFCNLEEMEEALKKDLSRIL